MPLEGKMMKWGITFLLLSAMTSTVSSLQEMEVHDQNLQSQAIPASNWISNYSQPEQEQSNSPGALGASWPRRRGTRVGARLLATWNAATSKADYVVAKDGSGTHQRIGDALAALAYLGHNRPQRVIIYVKSGVYNEKVTIGRNLNSVMFVGDGIDRTIVTGHLNYVDNGLQPDNSATFDVSGNGFWARDMTFENTAGPFKGQAVALRVASDRAVFYRCSFKGYQDTLYVAAYRQFFRDCHIYGTIDFIFGNSAAVFQNCDIWLRNPGKGMSEVCITAQRREKASENTGFVIQDSRVRASSGFASSSIKGFLGRPWRAYSRVVFLRTYLDGVINPQGWLQWDKFPVPSTVYYAEYMNTGIGASPQNRVTWPGFRVLRTPAEAAPFGAGRFIDGASWIPETGVPFKAGI